MHQERRSGRSRAKLPSNVGLFGKGMSPAEMFDDTHGKLRIAKDVRKRVVVRNGGHATEQVFEGAPPEANVLGKPTVLANR